MEFLYNAKTEAANAFGKAWCGPERFQHGEQIIVAKYAEEEGGQPVEVFCTAMPAIFYTLIVSPNASATQRGYIVSTGSGMTNFAAETARAISTGMLTFNPATQ